MKEKVIFFDIDGVLNTSEQWNRAYSLKNSCIATFCTFVKKSKADIVMISSWRKGFVSKHNMENLPQIRVLEEKLANYGVEISDKTPVLVGRKRDKEIERYLYMHPEVKSYIIIDDDKNEYDAILKGTYFIDAKVGFTKKDIRRCLYVFRRRKY